MPANLAPPPLYDKGYGDVGVVGRKGVHDRRDLYWN